MRHGIKKPCRKSCKAIFTGGRGWIRTTEAEASMMLRKVVLPEPLSPSTATNSFSRKETVMPSTARVSSSPTRYTFRMSFSSNTYLSPSFYRVKGKAAARAALSARRAAFAAHPAARFGKIPRRRLEPAPRRPPPVQARPPAADAKASSCAANTCV